MELTYHTNKYGHKKVKCPFCSRECFVREATKATPNVLCNLMRHITVEAKNEALEAFMSSRKGEVYTCLHLDYFIEHTTPQEIPKKQGRKFDDSLSLKN